jgi:nitroreductase
MTSLSMNSILKFPMRAVFRVLPGAEDRARLWKFRLKLLAKLRYYLSDIAHARRFMSWSEDDDSYWKLSSELTFQFHKLEKGLCIGGPKRFFGRDPVIATCRLVERWHRAGLPSGDPVFVGAIETLRAYRRRLAETPPPPAEAGAIYRMLDRCMALAPEAPQLSTPLPYRQSEPGTADVFDRLCMDRRSVRAYRADEVPMQLLNEAIEVAQFSPSACNRQPWHVHIYRDPSRIKAMLELQNGNAGFGHTLTTLCVITADANAFFDASERNEQFIDAGLFTMSLVLSLQARGLASCCLNWCVTPDKDREAHRRGDIPEDQKIIMYLAVGYAAEEALVPRSPRRALSTVVSVH